MVRLLKCVQERSRSTILFTESEARTSKKPSSRKHLIELSKPYTGMHSPKKLGPGQKELMGRAKPTVGSKSIPGRSLKSIFPFSLTTKKYQTMHFFLEPSRVNYSMVVQRDCPKRKNVFKPCDLNI